MNKFITAIKRSPKRTASLLTIAVAVMIPAGLLAWGPDRPTYTYETPADHVTFNSITNNPTYGDERNFTTIRDANGGTFGHEVNLQPGKEYEVQVFYHNNAATYLNDASQGYKGIAENAAMRVQMPATVKAGEKARITGVVSASNATPQSVWDEAYAASSSNVALRYVQGSAKVASSNGAVNGQAMPDSLLTTGAPLGYDSLNGKLPGCNKYSGYVTFRFVVDKPDFTVEKTVSPVGKNAFAKSINAKAGEQVEYKIQYKNTGTTRQTDVTIKDTLPKGVTYVPGTTQALTSTSGGQYTKVSDNVTTTGINLGAFAPNGNTFVKFIAKVTDNKSLEKCGINTLVNKATAITNNGQKDDTANVVVSKECEGNIKVCDLTTNQIISIKESDFDSNKHSKNVADCAEDNIHVCDVTTGQIVTIKESDFDSNKHSKNFDDCVEMPTELPQTGVSGGAMIAGAGAFTALIAYAFTNRRIRNLLIG